MTSRSGIVWSASAILIIVHTAAFAQAGLTALALLALSAVLTYALIVRPAARDAKP